MPRGRNVDGEGGGGLTVPVPGSVQLEKYELLAEIGHGGMATVFRARDRRLGREVAVKLIHPHLRRQMEVAERFVREATAVAKLKHPNIVEVFDISDAKESERYLVVELVRGPSLRERLDVLGKIPPEVAAALVLQIGAGLAHAHARGVVHRDVKPENVLVERRAADEAPTVVDVKLTDFGIAKLLDAQGVTSTGQVLGSPAHMAPEQIEGGVVDSRIDVFALGVLFYECVVGSLPFTGQHPAQVLRRVLEGQYPPPERCEPTVGARYARILGRALERDQDARFPGVPPFLEALQSELEELGFGRPADLLPQLFEPDPAFSHKLPVILAEAAERARVAGRLADAGDHLNRALAYRPGDRELFRRLAALRRKRRLGQAGRVALFLVGGLGVALLLAWVLPPRVPEPLASRPPAQPLASAARPSELPDRAALGSPELASARLEGTAGAAAGSQPGRVPSLPGAEAAAEPATKPPALRPAAPSRGRSGAARSRTPGSPAVREVAVRITGAIGGTLKIDGQEKPWFGGVTHTLPVGPHRFEFVAPDPTCCLSSEQTVQVRRGPGVQQVVGEIAFKDAVLRIVVTGESYGTIACPTLFSTPQRFPGDRTVVMHRARAVGQCTLRLESPLAVPPERRSVLLTAGRTTVVAWP